MIYLDTSVALAALFGEEARADDNVWSQPLISSRLMEYELWVRMHAHGIGEEGREAALEMLRSMSLVEMHPAVLRRAVEPFPSPVRTLDALHLATVDYLRNREVNVRLATFDRRMQQAGEAMGIESAQLLAP